MSEDWIQDEVVVDRSTLDRWATCPMQAGLIEAGLVIDQGLPLVVGVEAHDVLSLATAEYVNRGGSLTPDELMSIVVDLIGSSRVDTTTRVFQTLRTSLRSWAQFICDRRPEDLLKFDGGQGDQSGQLAIEFDSPAVQVTSEVDLLYVGPSPDVLCEVDYKTGFAMWTEDEIRHSFQFQLHAVLVFESFPEAQCLELIVWDTRVNHRTFRVRFFRRDESLYRNRVLSAAKNWIENRAKPLNQLPTWPESSKCSGCSVAQYCPRCKYIETDPVELVRNLKILETARKNVMGLLAKHVHKRGDIVTPEGDCYGKNKPSSGKVKPNALYSLNRSEDPEDES